MAEDNQQPRRRLTAEEVRKKYGIGSILLLAWEIWCIRDGWFHAQYEYVGFSRFMAYLSAPVLAFCVIMAVSAARALHRQREQPRQDESTGSPSQPT
ncbi:MAG: hypothetical protein ABSA12_09085 [Verrucomicrobiia bacterium]|jgi:hypothetical protein